MSEWIHSNVGAVTAYQRAGGTPTATTDAYYGGEIPFVTIEDITNGTRYLDKTVKNLSELGLRTSAAWLIKEPHILYSMYATVGKPIINRIACATNQAIIALKETDAIEQKFLFYQLLFIRPQVYKFTSQTTQSNLNASSVRKLPVAYPRSKQTQRKIATILSTIDAAIEQTEALIEKYQHIKAGLMHDLFTRGVLPNGQLRPPREQAPELYQETAIGWIPREWVVKPLGSLCEMTSGGTPSRNVPSFWGGSIPWIKTGEIKYQEISDTEEHITLRALSASSAKIFPAGTIVMAMYGEGVTRGRVAILATPCASNQACIGFFLGNQVQSNYMYYFFEYSYDALRDLSNDGSQKNLSSGLLRQFEINHPIEKTEQEHIAIRLSALDEKLARETKHLLNLNNQKFGLMQDLLTGKVPVKVEPEPEALEAAGG
jgi:type I restriction enzyme S subunit